MKISESTFDVLKNFSTINPSLAFKKGSKLRTVSPQKNILAEATISESFPVNFGIYELNKFLGLTTLFDDADFQFENTAVKIKEGRNIASYTYTDESMINTPPDNNIELPSTDVEFSLNKDSYRKVLTGANQLQLPEVVVRGKDGVISLVATDTKNPTTNEYSIEVGTSPAVFQFVFKTENLKMIVDDYAVKISKTGIAEFSGSRVNYWVATEKDSTYDI